MSNFTNPEKEELRIILAKPLVQKALQIALSDVLAGTYGESSMEGAAMAYKKAEGARTLVSQLFTNVDAKAAPSPTHRRFKAEPAIS